jgi:hypothetical protein
MTSLISDLRLSISDLRSSVGPGAGLGAALSEYARSRHELGHQGPPEPEGGQHPACRRRGGAAAADRARGGRALPAPTGHEEPVRHTRGGSALGEPRHRG